MIVTVTMTGDLYGHASHGLGIFLSNVYVVYMYVCMCVCIIIRYMCMYEHTLPLKFGSSLLSQSSTSVSIGASGLRTRGATFGLSLSIHEVVHIPSGCVAKLNIP